MMLSTITLSFLVLLVVADTSSLQYMGRAMSFDWHFRSQRLPPYRNTLDLKADYQSTKYSKTYKFVAFGKRWTLELELNTMLVSPNTTITERSVNGSVLREYHVPRDCFYVGTARGDNSEYGMASLTICGGQMRGLLVTNLNDYVIYERGWKTRGKRDANTEPVLSLKVADVTNLKGEVSSIHRRSTRAEHDVSDDIIQTPLLQKLPPPKGRRLFVELGVILDQPYMADFKEQVSPSRYNLVLHVLETYNNAQLWFLHPTFGLQLWLIVKDVVFVNDDIPLTVTPDTPSHPAAICEWARRSFPDNNYWDEIFIMSSKEGIWHGRVGLAQRAGVCTVDGKERCAGVTHVNFQKASLARLIAHEGMHPLGVGDDYEGRTSNLCFSGIMRRGVWQDHDWAVCSVQEFERWAGCSSSDCLTRRKTTSHLRTNSIPRIAVNVAWRSRVQQSSTYGSEEDWGAWKATDGPIAGVPVSESPRYGSCTHTLSESEPWIRVELDRKYSANDIGTVVIYNRDDCCSERLSDFEVRIGDSAIIRDNPLCAYYPGVVTGGKNGAAAIKCISNLSGKYVTVQLRGHNRILTVCEIQIMQKIEFSDFDYRENSCVDHEGFCPYWASVGECSNTVQQGYMFENCPYSCGKCKRPAAAETPPHQNAPSHSAVTMPTTVGPSESCVDSHESCSHYAANGDCWIELDMPKRCPRSCGFCTTEQPPTTTTSTATTTAITTTIPTTTTRLPTTTSPTTSTAASTTQPASTVKTSLIRVTSDPYGGKCVDQSAHCAAWVRRNYCMTSSIVRRLCVKSCDGCEELVQAIPQEETIQTCQDHSTSCRRWKARGRCLSPSVHQKCPKTCTNCGADNLVETFTTPPTIRQEKTTLPTTKTKCEDKNKDCHNWMSIGHCSVSVVQQTCPKSCGLCSGDQLIVKQCTDSSISCVHWARNNLCTRTSVRSSCKKSCQIC